MATLIHYPQRTEFSDTVPARLVVKLHSSLTLIKWLSDTRDVSDQSMMTGMLSFSVQRPALVACVGLSVLRTR